jgi:hypothetical protein
LLLLAGCDKNKAVATPDPDAPGWAATQPVSTELETVVTQSRRALSTPVNALPVTKGTLPLVYIVESTAVVRVVDETTKKTLTTANVIGGNILSVATSGITIGSQKLTDRQLEADHQYAVYLDSDSGGEVRSTHVRPTLRSDE